MKTNKLDLAQAGDCPKNDFHIFVSHSREESAFCQERSRTRIMALQIIDRTDKNNLAACSSILCEQHHSRRQRESHRTTRGVVIITLTFECLLQARHCLSARGKRRHGSQRSNLRLNRAAKIVKSATALNEAQGLNSECTRQHLNGIGEHEIQCTGA